MASISSIVRIVATILAVLFTIPSYAAYSQYGPKTNYSSSEIANAVRNSDINPYLKQYADQLGNLGRFESSGNAGIFNGSCCTGIFQMNTSNLRSFGLTREQYANMGLQEQVNVWAKLTNGGMNSGPVKQLMEMQKNGQTLGGEKVDGALVMACIQLGTGNCQKALASGSCSGFADINGTSICKMAAKMRDGKDTPGDPNKSTEGPTNTNTSGGSTEGGQMMGDVQDKSPAECWGCDAVTISFTIADKVAQAIADQLVTPALPLLSMIFALVMAVKIGKSYFFMTSQSTRVFADSWRMLFKFAFVMTVIGTSGFYNSITIPYILAPAVGIASETAQKLGDVASTAFSGQTKTGSCNFKPTAAEHMEMNRAGEQMAQVMCGVHLKMMQTVQKIGKAVVALKNHLTGMTGIVVGFFMTMLSFLAMIALVMSLVVLAFQIVEAILRMGFCVTMMPFALYLWIYKPTENLFYSFLRNIVYGAVLMVLASILASATLGMASVIETIAGDPTAFGTGSDDLANSVKYIIAMTALGALSATMLGTASPFATQITGATAELASGASAPIGAMMQGFSVASGVAGVGASAIGKGLGMGAAKVLPGVKGSLGQMFSGASNSGIKAAPSAVDVVKGLSGGSKLH